MTNAQWQEMHDFMNVAVERAAFFFADVADDALVVQDYWPLVAEEDYVISTDDHLVLADEVRPKVIERAHASGRVAVESHSHYWPGDDTVFSWYDLQGLSEFAPHMLWRLRGRPYVSVVVGEDSFDALIWTSATDVAVLDGIELSDGPVLRPTGLSLARYERVVADEDQDGDG
jgi:hypothetical protein